MDKGKQRLKQEMVEEKLCALQEAKDRLEREHHEALEKVLKVSRSEAENSKVRMGIIALISSFLLLFTIHQKAETKVT